MRGTTECRSIPASTIKVETYARYNGVSQHSCEYYKGRNTQVCKWSTHEFAYIVVLVTLLSEGK